MYHTWSETPKDRFSRIELQIIDVFLTSDFQELERHLQNIQKNHRHELGIERARQKDTNKKMMELRDENEKMEIVIKVIMKLNIICLLAYAMF